MLGSLSEFLEGVKEDSTYLSHYNYEQKSEENQRSQSYDERKHKFNRYEATDKTKIMRSNKIKTQISYKPTHQLMAWINHQPEKRPSPRHWIENKSVLYSDNCINSKHKLLRAVIKTKELEGMKNPKSLFDRSFQNISQQFSKIKSQPTQTMLIDPLKYTPNLFLQQMTPQKHGRSCPLSPQKMIQYEKSVMWAKKHRKNYKSFYRQLGKSIQLVDQEGKGKSNYELQKGHESKQGEMYRKKNRRQFLDKIKKRLSKHPTCPAE